MSLPRPGFPPSQLSASREAEKARVPTKMAIIVPERKKKHRIGPIRCWAIPNKPVEKPWVLLFSPLCIDLSALRFDELMDGRNRRSSVEELFKSERFTKSCARVKQVAS
jgi:hypothetical protein